VRIRKENKKKERTTPCLPSLTNCLWEAELSFWDRERLHGPKAGPLPYCRSIGLTFSLIQQQKFLENFEKS
jgi:hypothetical protein